MWGRGPAEATKERVRSERGVSQFDMSGLGISSITVDANFYEVGDRVMVYSTSKKKWTDDGVVVDIDKKGRLHVVYDKRGNRLCGKKWVTREQALTVLKKRMTKQFMSKTTMIALLRKQLSFLDSLISRRKQDFEQIGREIQQSKNLKLVLLGELAKLEDSEKMIKETIRQGLNPEDIIKHKEVKSLEVCEGTHTFARIAESMIFALRWSIMRQNRRVDKLKNADYNECITAKFPESGSGYPYHTPAHRLGDFSFKDYAPKVFKKIREECTPLSEIEYLEEIAANQKFREFISNSRSGEFFFYSYNGRFMIKTISKAECDFLRHNVKMYHQHLIKFPKSLLTRVYGVHRVKIKGKSLKFVVMANVFFTPKYIHAIFDLKGSRGRTRMATPKDFARAPTERATSTVLKDNDFVDRDIQLRIGAEKAAELKETIKNDIEFLQKLKVVDYSMLLGIHYADRPTPGFQQRRSSHHSSAWVTKSSLEVPATLDRSATITDDTEGTEGSSPLVGSLEKTAGSPSALMSATTTTAPIGDSVTTAMSDTTQQEFLGTGLSVRDTRALSFPIEEEDEEKTDSDADTAQTDASDADAKAAGPKNQTAAPNGKGAEAQAADAKVADAKVADAKAADAKAAGAEVAAAAATEEAAQEGLDFSVFPSTDQKTTFFVGVIDFFIQYGVKKKLENMYKTSIQGNDESKVSVIPPDRYAKRFMDFLFNYIR